jgi:hypothetical protein
MFRGCKNVNVAISSSTGNVNLSPTVVETPSSERTVTAELGEKTPSESFFPLDGDAERVNAIQQLNTRT